MAARRGIVVLTHVVGSHIYQLFCTVYVGRFVMNVARNMPQYYMRKPASGRKLAPPNPLLLRRRQFLVSFLCVY